MKRTAAYTEMFLGNLEQSIGIIALIGSLVFGALGVLSKDPTYAIYAGIYTTLGVGGYMRGGRIIRRAETALKKDDLQKIDAIHES